MSSLIFTCWGLSVAAELALLAAMIRSRLTGSYPGVALWALISSASAINCAYAHFAGNGYGQAWGFWQPFALAATIGLTIDVVSAISRQWPKARNMAVVVNLIFGGVSLAAMGWVAHLIPAHGWGSAAALVRLSEHFYLACAATIAANWLIYSIPRHEWRKNVRLHVRAALALTAGCGAAYLIGAASRKEYWMVAAANLLLTTATIAACVLWARMSRPGEDYRDPSPDRGLLESLEELDRGRIDRPTG